MDTPVSRPYAAAAFRYAQETGTIDSWQTALTAMADATRAVQQILESGVFVSEAQAVDIATEAAQLCGGLDEAQQRFVALLAENDRVFVLPAIAARFEALRLEAAGIVRVRIESALPMSDTAGFDDYLEKRLGRKVQSLYEENSALIGGVRVYVNDDVIDASIRGRLDRMAETLTKQAAASSPS